MHPSEQLPGSSLEVVQSIICGPEGQPLEMLAVGGGEPSFLLPRNRAVAAAICTSYNALRPRRRRAERLAVAVAVRAVPRAVTRPVTLTGPPDGASEDPPLLAVLEDRLGTRLFPGIGLGQLDSWWKPVLQLFDATGRPVAYAKVGWTPLTKMLVSNEARALESLPGAIADVIAPELLHSFEWNQMCVSVTAPLPRRSRRIDSGLPTVPRSLEVSGAQEQSRPVPGSSTGFWQELVSAATSSRHVTPEHREMIDAAGEILGAQDVRPVRFHGDWVPWNLATDPGTGCLVVWDWEYSHPEGVPGIDIVHGRYQIGRLLEGLDDRSAFDKAHRNAASTQAVGHAAMVMSRRLRAADLGAADAGTDSELSAACGTLDALLNGRSQP